MAESPVSEPGFCYNPASDRKEKRAIEPVKCSGVKLSGKEGITPVKQTLCLPCLAWSWLIGFNTFPVITNTETQDIYIKSENKHFFTLIKEDLKVVI